jgi:hypothetical protein
MKFKITAIKPVRVLVKLSREVPCARGTRPESYEEWVSLKSGQVQDEITMILGIDPKYIPQGVSCETTQTPRGEQIASIGIHGKEKKIFFGLFQFEPSTVQD